MMDSSLDFAQALHRLSRFGGQVHVFPDKLVFFTQEYEYSIRYRAPRSQGRKDKGYLGGTVTCRNPYQGEDWRRGRDLADGPMDSATWTRLLSDIVAFEMRGVRATPVTPGGAVTVGEGRNHYYLSIQFSNGRFHNFVLRSNAPSLLGQDLLNAVAEAAPFLVEQAYYAGGEGNIPKTIHIGEDVNGLPDTSGFWLYWKASSGATPSWEMTYSLESVETVFPGQANAWVYHLTASGQNYTPPKATTFIQG